MIHIRRVLKEALYLNRYFNLKLRKDLITIIVAFHDLGYETDHKNHEIVSDKMFREDIFIHKYLNEEESKLISQQY